MTFGAVEHPIEVREALLRALAIAGEPKHPFWARGFVGPAAIRKLAEALYTWLTGVVPDPDLDDDARGEVQVGLDGPSVRRAAPVVPVKVATLVQEAMSRAGSAHIGELGEFERRLTAALVEAAEADLRQTDPGRRPSTQELFDSSLRRRRDTKRRPERSGEYLSPWKPVTDGDALQVALKLELGDGHVLEGRSVRALARRSGSSEVLFELVDDAPVVAVVHLRWAPPDSSAPHLPWTRLYQDLETWHEHGEAVDHALWKQARSSSDRDLASR